MTTTSSTLPVELQSADQQLRSLVKPSEPHLHDTVKESETISEGDHLLGWFKACLEPWWSENAFYGIGDDSRAGRDFLIFVPFSFLLAPLIWSPLKFFVPDLGNWIAIFLFFFTALLMVFVLTVLHVKFQKCAHMAIYNRVIRRNWVAKMRADDELQYQDEVASYPRRLREYEEAKRTAMGEARAALTNYHATRSSRRYKLGENGFE